MNKITNREFITSIVEYSVSYILITIINIVAIPILTRLLSVEDYGYFSMFSNCSAFLSSIFSLGMRNGYIRYFNEPPHGLTELEIRVNGLLIPLLINFFSLLSVLIFRINEIPLILLGDKNLALFVLVCVNAYVVYFFNYLTTFYRMKMDIKNYTFVQVLSSLLTKTSILLVLFVPKNTFTISVFSILGPLIYMLILIIKRYNKLKKFFSLIFNTRTSIFKKYYYFSLSSWPMLVISYANQYLIQNVITFTLNARILGIYSSILVFSGIINAIKGGFSTYWNSFVYKYYKSENYRIRDVQDISMFFLILISLTMVIFRDFIFFMVGEEFRAGKSIFLMVLIYNLFAFECDFTSFGCNIKNKPIIISLISLLSLIINITIILIFGNNLGLLSIGIASLFSSALYFFVNSYFGQKYYRSIKNFKRTIFTALLIIMLSVANYFCNGIQLLLICFFIFMISLFIYRSYIHLIYRLIKKYIK